MKFILILTLLLYLTLPTFADQLHTETQGQVSIPFGKGYDYSSIKVKRVIDGYTIQLEDGKRVRYIGINTETKDPRRPVEFMGKEAYEYNKKLVEGKKVRLEFDVQKKDKYGRLLAYVYISPKRPIDAPVASKTIMVNLELVRLGYAQVATYPPNVKYAKVFEVNEGWAREAKNGLWSDTALAQEEVYYVGSKHSQVFHRPECPYASKIADYNRVKYNSREEAVKKGKRGCSKCKP